MKKTLKLATGLMLGALFAGSVSAKTLVYCSEGSPEGFDPALYTSGTTFDASSHPIYNRLAEFEVGTTNVIPGLAERWEASADGLSYTFHLRKGVRFHQNKNFTPSRDFNADDVIFSFERQRVESHPYNKVSGGTWEYFDGMDMPSLIKSVEKVDDYTVRFNLNRPEAPFIANMAMDFASILSAEYGDQMSAAGRRIPRSAGDQPSDRTSTMGFLDRTQDVRCGPARSDPDQDVVGSDRDSIKRFVCTLGIIFKPLTGASQCRVTSGDDSNDARGIRIEGRRTFRRIKHAEPAAGARSDVDQSPTGPERRHHPFDQRSQLRTRTAQ